MCFGAASVKKGEHQINVLLYFLGNIYASGIIGIEGK